MEIADPSELSFIKFPQLGDVVERYGFVCREIEEQAAEFLFEGVTKSYLASGGSSEDLTLRMGMTNPVGTFDLYIINARRSDRPAQPIVERVGGFGPIRAVTIECSESLRPHLEPHLEFFIRSLESFQRLFEQKFIELHERSSDKLVAGIEPLLLSVCGRDEAEIIKGQCRLSVTPARDGTFRFHISGNQIGTLIHQLSSRKFEFEPDPVLSMTSFLYGAEHDFFYERFRQGHAGFLRAKFSETEPQSVNPSLQHVEKIINQSVDVSCIEIANIDGFSLQISTAPNFEETIRKAVSRCESALVHQFRTNISNHAEDRNVIGEKVRRTYLLHLSRLERFFKGSSVRAGIDEMLERIFDIFTKG